MFAFSQVARPLLVRTHVLGNGAAHNGLNALGQPTMEIIPTVLVTGQSDLGNSETETLFPGNIGGVKLTV